MRLAKTLVREVFSEQANAIRDTPTRLPRQVFEPPLFARQETTEHDQSVNDAHLFFIFFNSASSCSFICTMFICISACLLQCCLGVVENDWAAERAVVCSCKPHAQNKGSHKESGRNKKVSSTHYKFVPKREITSTRGEKICIFELFDACAVDLGVRVSVSGGICHWMGVRVVFLIPQFMFLGANFLTGAQNWLRCVTGRRSSWYLISKAVQFPRF